MKVYVVEHIYGSTGGTVIIGAFSSLELANKAIERTRAERGYIGGFGDAQNYLVNTLTVDTHIWLGEMGVIHE